MTMDKTEMMALAFKPRKHFFSPREDDFDTCRQCGHNIRVDVHCMNDERPESDAQYIERLESALRLAAGASAASVKAGEVKVKALEWSEHKGPDGNCCYDHVTASSTIGGYSIEWKGWKDNDSYAVSRDEASVTFEYTLDTAKAAAQADYEARILAALTPEPAKAGDAGSMREALELAKPLIDNLANNAAAGSFEAKRAIAEALSTAQPDTAAQGGKQSDGGVSLSASERACYLWPDDTDEARASRAAYVDGALASQALRSPIAPAAPVSVDTTDVTRVVYENSPSFSWDECEAIARALRDAFKMERK